LAPIVSDARMEQEAREAERLRVVHVTMRTVQDIVNNCLNQLSSSIGRRGPRAGGIADAFDEAIHNASAKLKALGDRKKFTEKRWSSEWVRLALTSQPHKHETGLSRCVDDACASQPWKRFLRTSRGKNYRERSGRSFGAGSARAATARGDPANVTRNDRTLDPARNHCPSLIAEGRSRA